MWTSQGAGRQGQMNQGSPYGAVQMPGQPQHSPMLGPVSAYQNPGGMNMNMQSSPMQQPMQQTMQQTMGGWSIVSPYMTHHGEMAIIDGSPPTPEDEVTLWEAREFGKNDRLNKDKKRERLQILNSHGGSSNELSLDLSALQPSEGTTVLEMAKSLYEDLSNLMTSACRPKTRTLSFSLAEDAPMGPKATIGLLLGDQGGARCQVHGCVPGSPAYLSGKLQKGDVINQVDNAPVSGANIISRIRGDDSPGSKVTLNVERAGKKRPMEIGLIRAPVQLVNKRKQLYEMITNLAQMAGASPFESEVDDGPTTLGRDCHAVLKEILLKTFENEVLLKEEIKSREGAVYEAQKLLENFVLLGKKSLADNPSQQENVTTPIRPAPDAPRPMGKTDVEKGNRVNLVKAMKAAQEEAAKFQKLLGELEAVNTEQAGKLKEKEAEISKMVEELEGSRAQEEGGERRRVQVEQVKLERAAPPPPPVGSGGAADGGSDAAANAHTAAEEAWRRTKDELTRRLLAAEERAEKLSTEVEKLVESGIGSSLESTMALLQNKVSLWKVGNQRQHFEVTQLKAQLRAADARQGKAAGEEGTPDSPSASHGGAGAEAGGDGMEEVVGSLREEVAGLSGQVEGLMAEMAAKDAELSRLADQTAQQQGQMRELASALSDKDVERERLAQRLAEKEGNLGEVLAQQARALRRENTATHELERLSAEVARLGAALEQREQELSTAAPGGESKGRGEAERGKEQEAELKGVQERFERFKEEATRSRELAETALADQSHRIASLESKLRADYDKAAIAQAEAAAARKEAEHLRRQLTAVDRATATSSPAVARAGSSGLSASGGAEVESLRVELEESRVVIAQLKAELAAPRPRSSDALPASPVSAIVQPQAPRQSFNSVPTTPLQARAAKRAPEEAEDVGRLREELRRTQEEVQQERRAYAAGVERLKRQRDQLAAELASLREPSLLHHPPPRPAPPQHAAPPTRNAPPSPQAAPATPTSVPSAPKLMSPAVQSQRLGTPSQAVSDPIPDASPLYHSSAARFHTARAAQPQMRM